MVPAVAVAGTTGTAVVEPAALTAAATEPRRRIVAAIAVVTLILASGAVGAIISVGVNHNSTPAASSPNNGFGNDGNGFNGFGSQTPNTGSGNSNTTVIADKVNPALVNIYTTIGAGGEAAGTGMVITSSGEVLTNNHVIADATTVKVELPDRSTHSASVLGYDVKDDVALVKINGVSNLSTVSFADATKVAIGDAVVAIGNVQAAAAHRRPPLDRSPRSTRRSPPATRARGAQRRSPA